MTRYMANVDVVALKTQNFSVCDFRNEDSGSASNFVFILLLNLFTRSAICHEKDIAIGPAKTYLFFNSKLKYHFYDDGLAHFLFYYDIGIDTS